VRELVFASLNALGFQLAPALFLKPAPEEKIFLLDWSLIGWRASRISAKPEKKPLLL